MNTDIASESCSTTVTDLLNEIYTNAKSTILIGNVVTSEVTHKPTPLQVTLGIEAGSKSQLNLLHTSKSPDHMMRH